MAATLDDLDTRLTALEMEVRHLRAAASPPAHETPAERGARLARAARANQPAISAAAAQAFQEMGLAAVQPVSHEQLRAMMRNGGVLGDANEFSREIIAMREE